MTGAVVDDTNPEPVTPVDPIEALRWLHSIGCDEIRAKTILDVWLMESWSVKP